jgi:uncharacterized CHY-type Zn-finger protein
MIALVVYGIGGILFLAIATYRYAVSTRCRVRCGGCGELVRMEYEGFLHCPSCEAPLA